MAPVGGLLAAAVTRLPAGLLAVPGLSTLCRLPITRGLLTGGLLGGGLLAEAAGLRSTGLLAVPPWGSGSAAWCSHRVHSFAYAAGLRLCSLIISVPDLLSISMLARRNPGQVAAPMCEIA